MRKVLITGGPSIGKTTVLEILASRGFQIVPEAARQIIDEERAKGSDILPWKNIRTFQEHVVRRQLELESNVVGDVVFIDRGIVDSVAYCALNNVQVPPEVELYGRGRYEKVFVLDSLGSYELDGVRSRSFEDAEKIHEYIQDAYRSFGYELISVPVMSPEERADFILAHV